MELVIHNISPFAEVIIGKVVIDISNIDDISLKLKQELKNFEGVDLYILFLKNKICHICQTVKEKN